MGNAALLWGEPCAERTLGKRGNTASKALLWVEPFATQTLGRLGKPPERSGITQSGTTQSEAELPSLPLNAPLLSLAATDTREFLAEASLGAKPATFRLYKTL